MENLTTPVDITITRYFIEYNSNGTTVASRTSFPALTGPEFADVIESLLHASHGLVTDSAVQQAWLGT
jgi:hypothetical protein